MISNRLFGGVGKARLFKPVSWRGKLHIIRGKSKAGASHHDIFSFLEYARATGQLQTNNSNFRGTLYEYSTLECLRQVLGSDVFTRSGRAGDNGVDIIGLWDLSRKLSKKAENNRENNENSSKPRLIKPNKNTTSVIVQCKNTSRNITASLIRQLAGIYQYFTSNNELSFAGNSSNGLPTIIMVAAPTRLTAQGISQLDSSNIPMIFCRILALPLHYYMTGESVPSYSDIPFRDLLKGALVNRAASEILDKYKLDFKRIISLERSNDDSIEKSTKVRILSI